MQPARSGAAELSLADRLTQGIPLTFDERPAMRGRGSRGGNAGFCAADVRSGIADFAYRFGVGHPPADSREKLQDAARRIEALELDFITEGDHLGGPAPFSLLTAAAGATERVRLRTYVLNVGFWVPALTAREAATLDVLSDGRLELGVGAGTVRAEFDEAGLPWRPASERIDQMETALLEVRWRLADESHVPRPVQRPIPILVGAMSREGLTVAAEQADIVAFSALRHARGRRPGTLTAATAEETDEFVALVREQAKDRRFESDVLLQTVELGRDPVTAARRAVEREYEGIDPAVLAQSPCALFARSAAEAAAELERRRDRWGFTSFTTFWSSAEALAQVRRELA